MHRRLRIHIAEREHVIIFPHNLRRNFTSDDLLEDRHRSLAARGGLTNETTQMLELRRRAQAFADKTDHFLAQRVAHPRPRLRAAEMFYARLQIAEEQTIRARVDQRADPF